MLLTISCQQNKPALTIYSSDSKIELKNGFLFFNESPFTGNLIAKHENGKLKSNVQYVAGRKHGYEKHFYINEALSVERFYNKGLKIGIHKALWQDATPKFEYHFNEKGEYDGVVKEWYNTGQIYRFFNYENGKEIGSQRLWKLDGNIKANYEVVNGERFGLIGLKKCYTVTVNSDEVE